MGSSNSDRLKSFQPNIPEDTTIQEPSLSVTLETLKSRDDEASKSPAFKVLAEVVESGSECAVQTLYEGPAKCACCKNWIGVYPDDLKSSIEQQIETQKKALVVRMGKNHEDGKPLVLDSIVVQSQFLKNLLGEVFHGYEGITTNLQKLVFKSPFHAFYHRWDLLAELANQRKDEGSDAAVHAQLLYNVLDIELREARDEINDLVKNEVITYHNLWAIFSPGSLVFATIEDQDRVFLLRDTSYQKGYIALRVESIDSNGKLLGYRRTTLGICNFSGTQRITDLDVYPLKFHPSRNEVEEAVKARGETFRNMHGFHYVSYKGRMLHRGNREMQRQDIDERIIVDASFHGNNSQGDTIVLESLDTHVLAPTIQVADDRHIHGPAPYRCGSSFMGEIPKPSVASDLPINISNGKRHNGSQNMETEFDINLTPEQLLLCNSHVRGYSLKSKRWGEFDVTNLRPISWNDAAFPHLMLPDGFKNLILSFIEGHATGEPSFDDIIEGKGLGIVMLLVGKPGVGKTLTAEAVADKVRRPLYVLSAGELGTDAEDVEDRLTSVLEMTEKWNAVLLFDECDVFLQKRSINHLAHNEVVAVFLRVLEYYRGILFMTTNRGDAIDSAFQSRIHLTLHYPDLDAVAKRGIWERLISRSEPNSILDDQSYSRLSELPLNGRQIRNTVKISLLLANKEKTPLGISHILTVLRVTGGVSAEVL
ncbi:hypothetical protein F5B21DRAFT_492349, partial [Xylaria acuta]